MKPSEKRALMEAKKKELEAQNNANDSVPDEDVGACDIVANHTLKDKKGKTILDDDVESMRKEGFFQNHVKLITFIITVSLLFALIGPFSIIRIIENIEESRHYKDGETLTIEKIEQIAKKKVLITWSDFDGYSYEDQSTKSALVREYYVKEEGYFLVVRGSKNDPEYPDNVHFMHSDENGTSFIDLRTQDIKGFLAAINTPDEDNSLRPMTLDDLIAMTGKESSGFSWANFKSFNYVATQRVEMGQVYYVRTYKIAGTNLEVVLEGKKISGYPDSAMLVNNVTLEKKDLKKDDVTDFIKEQKD